MPRETERETDKEHWACLKLRASANKTAHPAWPMLKLWIHFQVATSQVIPRSEQQGNSEPQEPQLFIYTWAFQTCPRPTQGSRHLFPRLCYPRSSPASPSPVLFVCSQCQTFQKGLPLSLPDLMYKNTRKTPGLQTSCLSHLATACPKASPTPPAMA